MSAKILRRDFFDRPTPAVAEALLGKILCRRTAAGKIHRSRIVETEAYDGFEDRASHAHRGATTRNVVMFGPPGYAYVYLCYGVHWLLNFTTREQGYPAAVLIRGVESARGPGRLTKAFSIDGDQNGLPVSRPNGLWVEDDGMEVDTSERTCAARIGVDFAGPEWAAKPWRFLWTAAGDGGRASRGRAR